jgi:predicted Zn-dependent peptidase
MRIVTLDNGLRAVLAKADSDVSYIGVAINAGSRDDAPELPGLAHFVEHTIFKGTEHRKSWSISNRMESVGGELNAYTSREETVINTNAPGGYADRALELISDIIKCANFPATEIDRERDVVIEEIHSYEDSPSDAVFDVFDELIYAGSAMSHNILGSEQSVRAITGADARRFVDRFYSPDNMVLYCVDPGDENRNIRLIERYFGNMTHSLSDHGRVQPAALTTPFRETRDEGNQQANTMLGVRIFGRQDPRRHAMFLLNNMLGGPSMNSRLNMEMRERRGLVYTVESNVALASDCGTFWVYYGTDPKSVDKCERIVLRQLDALAQSTLSEAAFNRARNQYIGQLKVSGDHRENMAMALGKSVLYFDEVHGIDYTTRCLMDLTAAQLREAAELILSTPMSRITII